MKKFSLLMTFVAVCCMSTVVFAQNRPQRGQGDFGQQRPNQNRQGQGGFSGGMGMGGGMGMMGGGSMVNLFTQNQSVIDELKLTETQIEKINKAAETANQSLRKMMVPADEETEPAAEPEAADREAVRAARTKKLALINETRDNTIIKVFTKKQLPKAQELMFQSLGGLGLEQPAADRPAPPAGTEAGAEGNRPAPPEGAQPRQPGAPEGRTRMQGGFGGGMGFGGGNALSNEFALGAIGVTPEQFKQIKEIQAKAQKASAELMPQSFQGFRPGNQPGTPGQAGADAERPRPGQGNAEEGDRGNRERPQMTEEQMAEMRARSEKMNAIMTEQREEIAKVFTDEQKAKAKELMENVPDYLNRGRMGGFGGNQGFRGNNGQGGPGFGQPGGFGPARGDNSDRGNRQRQNRGNAE